MGDIGRVSRHFARAAQRAPYLDHEEEHALAVRWRDCGDERALHRLTSAHFRLVMAQASRFRRYGLPIADLVQEGNVGLLEAALRFEPDRQVRFSTYAAWWIRASMQDYVLRNWSIVRGGTSSAQKALFFNLRRLKARASRDGATNDVLYGEIGALIGVSPGDVAIMDARLSGPDLSLNTPVGDGETAQERVDFLVDASPLPDESVGDALDRERRLAWLRQALGVLNARELEIVYERRLREEATTLEALGQKLGISKERVRQIENRALDKLRSRIALSAHAPACA